MVKPILQVYPTMGGPDEMEERRPIGRDREAYQNLLTNLEDLVEVADNLGYWGITHVEHHFHSEGLEISPNPSLLNVFLGKETEQLRMGQLGHVLPARDPIRLAEDIAMTDHMLEGRYFVGMARGYQSRWMDTLGQPYDVRETYSDGSEQDVRNREIFEENYEIMKGAWANEAFKYDGEHYKVPKGNPEWPPVETTQEYGAPGELDEENRVQKVSVVPSPYSDPHPPLFQAFSLSEETMRWCGREGIVPTILFGATETVRELQETHHAEAVKAGFDFEVGQNTSICRAIHFVDSEEELYEKIEKYEYPVWRAWYEPFGFTEALRFPDEEGPVPNREEGESLADRLIESGLVISGTVEEVTEELQRQLNECPAEYFVWLFHYGIIPKEEAFEDLRVFRNEVLPELELPYDA